jgi:hypothetical protein
LSLGDPYITGQDLADYAGMDTTNPDTVRDAQLLSAVSSASRAITMACGRDFNKETTATPRVFKPNGPRIILTDDFYTATNLIIQTGRINVPFGDPWLSDTYELEPFNNTYNGVPGFPFTRIMLPFFKWVWDIDRIQVTAQWGWQAIPDDVIQATKIVALMYYKLNTAPFGVAQFGSGTEGASSIKVKKNELAWGLLCGYEKSPRKVYLG